MPQKSNLLGLDVGSKRIGLAIVADGVAVPRTLPFLINDDSVVGNIKTILTEKKIDELVVGLPRNLDGDDTPQTAYVRQFITKLAHDIKLPIYLQDEALTSAVAENILKAEDKSYQKGDIDSLAAIRILLDYLGDS